MKQLKTFSIGLVAFALTAAGAIADWYRAAELSANGGAKEVGAVFENVRAVRIQCLEGSVAIGTLRVRSGSEKEEYHVDRSLGEGETHEIALDGREVTGFHVIDMGTGRYCIDHGLNPAPQRIIEGGMDHAAFGGILRNQCLENRRRIQYGHFTPHPPRFHLAQRVMPYF